MTVIEQDIRSIPTILRQTHARIDERRDALMPLLDGPMAFLGCGSSYCVAMALAALYEQERHAPGQAIIASDYLPRPTWTHVAISRTGETTELVTAMQRIHEAGGRCLLLVGEQGSPAEAHADLVLPLEFAAEQGVIQTRFVVAATQALRLLMAAVRTPLDNLPERMEQALATFDPSPLVRFDHVVFLGRGWCYGLASAAALNLQETALMVPEAHQTLDYRHGPIASADERTLVWCLDPLDNAASAAVINDVRRTGATVQWTEVDPLIAVAQAQLSALRKAEARSLDPMAPRHLSRAIIL
ncbi:MAG TPA: SIS domain-containing protein [Ktedonobacteraceae bacterium]|nr:SIS domain-containing protein [Ktedonobacteraceae bacterium]